MSIRCPKCTSIEVQMLSLVHGSEHAALSKVAAPPPKKRWTIWGLVAAVCTAMALANPRQSGLGAVVLAGLGTLAAGLSLNAWTYNARVHPALLERWQQSLMCNRCGEMFAPS
jgi:hypothetical protein